MDGKGMANSTWHPNFVVSTGNSLLWRTSNFIEEERQHLEDFGFFIASGEGAV